jgi:hypothetical protein
MGYRTRQSVCLARLIQAQTADAAHVREINQRVVDFILAAGGQTVARDFLS